MPDIDKRKQSKTDDNPTVYATEYIIANIAVNSRAAEDVAFGRADTGDDAPIERYLYNAGMGYLSPMSDDDSDGYIIENGKISDYDIDELLFDIYRCNIDRIFNDAPKSAAAGDDEIDICRYTDEGLYAYLKELYLVFREIMAEKAMPWRTEPDTDSREREFEGICKLLSAIGQGKLECGSSADEYINDITVSEHAARLLEKREGRYTVKNADRDSTDYKLALFSFFKFSDDVNAEIFADKLRQWQNRTGA